MNASRTKGEVGEESEGGKVRLFVHVCGCGSR